MRQVRSSAQQQPRSGDTCAAPEAGLAGQAVAVSQFVPSASAGPASLDGGGELWLCPICVESRDLGDAEKVPNARIAGATPMWEWAGSNATVFSY